MVGRGMEGDRGRDEWRECLREVDGKNTHTYIHISVLLD